MGLGQSKQIIGGMTLKYIACPLVYSGSFSLSFWNTRRTAKSFIASFHLPQTQSSSAIQKWTETISSYKLLFSCIFLNYNEKQTKNRSNPCGYQNKEQSITMDLSQKSCQYVLATRMPVQLDLSKVVENRCYRIKATVSNVEPFQLLQRLRHYAHPCPSMGEFWLEFVWLLCMLSQTLCVDMCFCLAVSRRLQFLEVIHHL